MAPGPKKKNFNKNAGGKAADNQPDIRKKPTSNNESQNRKNIMTNDVDQANKDTILNEDNPSKYSKRTIDRNWSKYDEPIVDPHADTMRGRDFEVLLSYSGGGDSQLRLQDEKEWEENYIEEKSITFDLLDLENAVKCIPFHRRLNLPADIFDGAQLDKFNSIAKGQIKVFESKLEFPSTAIQEKTFKEPDPVDPTSNIIESYESEEVCDGPEKSFVLEKKTESIIESLASSLSLKNVVNKSPEKCPDELRKNEAHTDDLDFLLSLSTNATSMNIVKEDKPKEKKQTNVDDWLNSLLDD
ncbi:hypothetical protein JTE90_018303 [Oedothorax gibbosus]|uniref:Cell death regulator Aven n=1 Tax=Oedothorax gibbosus TaxID=931172 RepID=A0AAV6UDD7_9ARAC|nr:hypothetical protein JTE90_018303 [Oedothorax gibbosus]